MKTLLQELNEQMDKATEWEQYHKIEENLDKVNFYLGHKKGIVKAIKLLEKKLETIKNIKDDYAAERDEAALTKDRAETGYYAGKTNAINGILDILGG